MVVSDNASCTRQYNFYLTSQLQSESLGSSRSFRSVLRDSSTAAATLLFTLHPQPQGQHNTAGASLSAGSADRGDRGEASNSLLEFGTAVNLTGK
jgi:hypothetical protein